MIVTDDDTPAGIVTETDLVQAGYVTDRPFSEIPARKVMSSPLATIDPEKTLRRATERMQEEGIKKLPVVDDMELVGILTIQDVIHNYSDLKSEIYEIAQPRKNRAAHAEWFEIE